VLISNFSTVSLLTPCGLFQNAGLEARRIESRRGGFHGRFSMGDPQESPLGFLSKLLRNLWMTSVANLEIMISCWENELNIELQCFAYVGDELLGGFKHF